MLKNRVDLNLLAADYLNGLRLAALSRKYGLSQTSIFHRLVRAGVPTTRKTYRYDGRFFAQIDTEQKAYFLGYLTTDGYLVEGPRRYVVTLTSVEPDIPRAFAAALGNLPVYEIPPSGVRRPSTEYRVSVCSKAMVEDLVALGLRQAKSGKETFCEAVPSDLTRHYLRGLFDGDGSLGTYDYSPYRAQHRISLVGSFSLLSRVATVLAESLNIPMASVRCKAGSLYVISWNGNGLAPRVANWLYTDSSIALSRKKAIAQSMAATIARPWTQSFYGRRLQEGKGSPRIDFECVICAERP